MNVQDNTKHRVYIDKIEDNMGFILKAGLEHIEWSKYVNKDSKVFVKPNFTFPSYKEGVTTTPKLIEHLLEMLKSRTDTVIVGESDGGNHGWKAETAFKNHGMYEICQKTGTQLVNLSKLPSETIESKILSKYIRVQLPRMLLEDIDCFISVPVLKVHTLTNISLSIKNLWGCVPDTMRVLQHQYLGYKLALIDKLIKPKIAIIDGIYALNKHGPMDGEPIKTNLIIVSDNPVAADTLGTLVMGFSPYEIEHLAIAEKTGLGSMKLEDMEINKDWRQYKRHFVIERSILDRITNISYLNGTIAKLIYDSKLTPQIYKVASIVRSLRWSPKTGQVVKIEFCS
jgi:uncharacterized protein (DUF362 family)